MKKRVLSPTEITEQVNEFWDFIGNSYIIPGHYLKPLCDKYLKWKAEGRLGPFPPLAQRLVGHATNFLKFKKDWDKDPIKKHVRSKLRDNNLVRPLLFEFRAATHFLLANKDAIWLANIGNKPEPDIKVITQSNKVVYVECIRKNEKEVRIVNDKVLRLDIIKGLRDKNKQRMDFDNALQIAVYIPEEYSWNQESFNSEIGEEIQSRFDRSEYNSISGLTVVSYESPIPKLRSDGQYSYSLSSPAITFLNRNARFPLPYDFHP